MGKRLVKNVMTGMAILSALGITATPVFAAIPAGTVVFGNGTAFDLGYANNTANTAAISQAVVGSNGKVWVEDFNNDLIDNNTGNSVPNTNAPATLTYTGPNGGTPTTITNPPSGTASTVASVSAINGTVTVTLSAAPTTTPTISNFTVMNGTSAVVPSAISTSGTTVTLTVPVIPGTTAVQNVVYTVNGVAAPAFTVAANSTQGLSNIKITGQLVGTGTVTSPAINSTLTSSNTITLASTLADVSGNPMSGVQTQVYTTSNAATATVNGTTIAGTALSPVKTIDNTAYTYAYPVTTDSSGNATITFANTASGTMKAIVVAPFSNNGSSVVSNAVSVGWGQPGSAVLAPVYTTAHNASLSTSANGTAGLNAFTATVIPQSGAALSTVANVAVEFTLVSPNAGGAYAMPYFTDVNGVAALAQTTTANTVVKYTVSTNASGQATIYVNNMQPISNGVVVANSSNTATVGVDMVGTTPVSQTSLLSWGSQGVPTQIVSMTPANAKNSYGTVGASGVITSAIPTNAQTATSGAQVTLGGVVEDAGGNPVPNATLYIVGNHQTGSSSYALGGSFIANGATSATNIDASHAAIVTSDANGNFSLVVTDTASSSVYNVPAIYDVYSLNAGAQPVTTFSSRTTTTPVVYTGLTAVGTYNVLWQQQGGVAAIGIAATAATSQANQTATSDTIQASYTSLSAIPTNASNGSKVIGAGADQTYWVAPFNSQANTVDPQQTSYSNLTETYTVTAPTGYVIKGIGGITFGNVTSNSTSLPYGVVDLGASGSPNFQYVTSVTYTVTKTAVPDDLITITSVNGQSSTSTAFTNATGNGSISASTIHSNSNTAMSSGHVMITVNSASKGGTSLTSNTAGGTATFNVSVSAVDSSSNPQGSASGNISATWTAQNTGTKLAVDTLDAPDILTNYTTSVPSGLSSSSALETGTALFGVAQYTATKALMPIDANGTNGPSSVTYTITAPGSAKINQIDGIALTNAVQIATVQIAATTSGSAIVETLTVNGAQLDSEMISSGGSVSGGSGKISHYGSGLLAQQEQAAGVLSVGVTDSNPETAAVQVSVGSLSSTATITFNATAANVNSISVSPASINTANGSSNTVTFSVLDINGNAIPNVPVTIDGLSTTSAGIWITAVNGTLLTQTTSSAITMTTPVPLYQPSSTVAGYSTVVVPGFNATGIVTSSVWQTTPTVTATTNSNGQIVLTLQAGNVTYSGSGGSNLVSANADYPSSVTTETVTAKVHGKTGTATITLN